MPADLCCSPPCWALRLLLQSFRDPSVQQGTPVRVELLHHRLADYIVREPEVVFFSLP
jgi:hypothetical protein